MTTTHIIALSITLFFEGLGMLIYSLSFEDQRKRLCLNLLLVLVVNLVSHTIFWYTFPLVDLPYWTKLYILEVAVFIVEGIAYRLILKLGLIKSLILSFILNLLSLIAGLLAWEILYYR
jgi:hypothetical protein